MARNEYDELSKITNKMMRSRMDPLSKLFLLVVVGVPVLLIIAGIFAWKLWKGRPKSVKKAKVKVADMPATDTVYYEVKKLKASEHSLTQYVSFYIIKDNDFVDVTASLRGIYPDLRLYKGRSSNFAGTVVLTDYEIIQLKRNLGDVNLVRTVGD